MKSPTQAAWKIRQVVKQKDDHNVKSRNGYPLGIRFGSNNNFVLLFGGAGEFDPASIRLLAGFLQA